MIRNKIFLSIFLVVLLVLVSFVTADSIIIIPPADTIPPIISNVQAIWINRNTVNITWETDEPSYFNIVEYGKGKKYEYSVLQQYNTNLTFPMISEPALSLTLDKLGNYHYRVGSCDLFGNCAYSQDYKIKKKAKKDI